MRLTVATNFDDRLIEQLEGYPVVELFGKIPADPLGGGRASSMLSPLSKRALAAAITHPLIKRLSRNMTWEPYGGDT